MQKPKLKTLVETGSSRPASSSNPLDRVFRQLFGLTQGWHKQRDIAKNNYDLGIKHFRAGNITDAVFRFKLVTWMTPGHADAWYWLGRSLLREGRHAEASVALQKAQSLKPGQEDTQYMLALALRDKAPADLLPTRMPPALIKEHFEGVAGEYETAMEAVRYRGHILVADAARTHAQQGQVDHVVLDLGVGTGLCGARLRDIASHISGVDISNTMLAEAMNMQDAQGRKLYDALIHREAVDFMQGAADKSFDMVLAAGLVDYVGDLDVLWQHISRVLKPRGLFVMTANGYKDGDGYRFNAEKEVFEFASSYLEGLAQKHQLQVVNIEEANIAQGHTVWLGVFRKP